MEARVHVDEVVYIGEQQATLEVFVIAGAVQPGLIMEQSAYVVTDIVDSERLAQYQTGRITVTGDRYVDVTQWKGVNLMFRSQNPLIRLKDTLRSRYQGWRERRQDESQQLKEP